MSDTLRARSRQKESPIPIVDVDVHIQETAEQLVDYCEHPWDVALHSVGKETFGSITPPVAAVYEAPFNRGQVYRSVESPTQLTKDLEGFGITKCILFP